MLYFCTYLLVDIFTHFSWGSYLGEEFGICLALIDTVKQFSRVECGRVQINFVVWYLIPHLVLSQEQPPWGSQGHSGGLGLGHFPLFWPHSVSCTHLLQHCPHWHVLIMGLGSSTSCAREVVYLRVSPNGLSGKNLCGSGRGAVRLKGVNEEKQEKQFWLFWDPGWYPAAGLGLALDGRG